MPLSQGHGGFLFSLTQQENIMINEPTMEQLDKLPRLYATEDIRPEDKIVHLHFILNQSHWWAIEWDGSDTFFGYVLLNGWTEDAEFGYFSLSELLGLKFEGWLEVLHDPFWIPNAMKDIYWGGATLPFQS
jgi:hypothetical protein